MLGSVKTAVNEAYEGGLRSLLSKLLNRKNAYMYSPQPDKQTLVQDRILSELETTLKFFEKKTFEVHKEKLRQKSKVDYTWLMSIPYKQYKMLPLERMEIETLAYQIKPEDVGPIVRRFNEQIIQGTTITHIPTLMMQTLRKMLGEYEIERYATELSRTSIMRRIRSESRVYPELFEMKDVVVITNSENVNWELT